MLWVVLVLGFVFVGNCWEVLRLYEFMWVEGFEFNVYILVSLLKVCGRKFDLELIRKFYVDV